MKANYYVGIKPQAIESEVTFHPDGFQIVFQQNGQPVQLNWELKNIRPDSNSGKQNLILIYGQQKPFEYLEFLSEDAVDLLQAKYPFKQWQNKQKSPFAIFGILSASVLALLIGMIGFYFLVAPKLADQLTRTIPKQWEVELGDKIMNQFLSNAKINQIKSSQLDSFFNLMNVPSGYKIKIHFIEDSIKNAFAMPGGNIVVYKGLFDHIKTYESLAGLLAHEFTHINNKHSLKTILRSASSYFILAALFGDLTGLAGVVIENAQSIQSLSYSRKFEEEADLEAAAILIDRKISLVGMLDLFKIFSSEDATSNKTVEFLSTHPVTENRIQYIQAKMAEKESDIVENQALKQLFIRLKE